MQRNNICQEIPSLSYFHCWKNRSKREKNVIMISALGALALVLFLSIYIPLNSYEECGSSTCRKVTNELLTNYIDMRVDPCEDFYRFSCGNFLEKAKLDGRESWSVRDLMEDEIRSQIKNMLEEVTTEGTFNLAKKFYRACMNESAIEAEGLRGMREIFREIGGWPTLKGDNWREDLFDWKNAIYKLRRIGLNFEGFFQLTIEKEGDKYFLNIQSPYRHSDTNAELKTHLQDFMIDIAVMMGAEKQRAIREQTEVLNLLFNLIKISRDATNGTNLYNPLGLSELVYEFPSVQWLEYINQLLGPDAQISHDDEISVSDSVYLKKLLGLLKYGEKRILANFMCWKIVEKFVIHLPRKFVKRASDFMSQMNRGEQLTRSKICINDVQHRLSSIILEAFVKKFLDDDTRDGVRKMIQKTKYQFRKNLQNLNWLDEKTKHIASETLLSSYEALPQLNDLIHRNKFYEKVEILDDKLLTSALNLDYATTNIQYGKLRQPAQGNFFQEGGTSLEIVYSTKENVLRIPAGRLQGVFYHKNRPNYMNYGALGTVIAHEMYHIITEAKYRGVQGELRSWWSSHSLLNYEIRLQCLSNHYGKFVLKMMENSNASSTRNEDMADLAGLKVAYDAYRSWVAEEGAEARLSGLNFTPLQLFWISSAVHHCAKYSSHTLQRYVANYRQSPGQFRVNGALQNLDEFATDFGCASGTPMNPVEKCQIW